MWSGSFDDWIQPDQDLGGQVAEFLIGPHYIQVLVRPDREEREDLIEHLPVLTCDAAADRIRSA